MFNPLDLLQGPGATGMQAMGHQFGLDPEQTRRAMEALMPAFALGLQRASVDPTGLAQLFGSPVLTQAVLQQASATSGIGSQVLRQMLPVMAGAVVASVVHMVLNQPAPAPAPATPPAGNPFPAATAWTEMMQAFLPAAEPTPPPGPAAQPSARRATPAPGAAGSGGADPGDADPGDADLGVVGRDMLQQLLKTGAEVQEQNVRAMQGLFDAFWTSPKPSGSSVGGDADDLSDGKAAPGPAAPKARRGRAPADK